MSSFALCRTLNVLLCSSKKTTTGKGPGREEELELSEQAGQSEGGGIRTCVPFAEAFWNGCELAGVRGCACASVYSPAPEPMGGGKWEGAAAR